MTKYLTLGTPLPVYLCFPRFLLDSDLSETSKILYMVLLDRARLSISNGWTDEYGHVFLYFTIEELAKVLHKSNMTIKNSLTALEQQGLIFRQRQGVGLPNRIYVKIPVIPTEVTDKKLSAGETENCPPDRQETVPITDRKLSGNKNKRNNNHSEKTGSKNIPSIYGSYQNVYLSDSELESLRETVPGLEQYIEKLSNYIASTGKVYKNHAATIRIWASKDKPAPIQRNYDFEEGESL